MKDSEIVIIAGRSGSGKTTLAKRLAEEWRAEELGFSYAGKYLSAFKREDEEFVQINDYLYHCITSAAERNQRVVLDGLASDLILEKLRAEYKIKILYLNTPDFIRIQRIAEREKCDYKTAEKIEMCKARGKGEAGLDAVILAADCELDGYKRMDDVLLEALKIVTEPTVSEEWMI